MNPRRADVLRLYKRAIGIAGPYVDSPGVREFMRTEMVRELTSHGVSREKILEIEQVAQKRENLIEACKDNVRTLFRDRMDEKKPSEIDYLLRQGEVELAAVEDKIIRQKRKFGMVKEGGDIRYVVTPSEE
jgi:hypothetical protein